MLSARLTVVQVLGIWQVGVSITEFAAGQDPTFWTQRPLTLELPEEFSQEDALSTILEVIRLWSERTIQA